MLVSLLSFEIKYHFKQVSFILAAIVFFLMGGFALSGGFGDGNVHKNGPYVITAIICLLSLFSIFAITVCCANVVLRDHQHRFEEVIFTTSIARMPYLATRFLGLLIASFSLLVFAAIGLQIRVFFLDQALLGAFRLQYFLHPLLVFGLPNLFFCTTILFATAILTKNTRAIYAAGVLIYILYMVASIFGNSPFLATSNFKVDEAGIFPFLIDPFGLASFFGETKSWPDALRNQMLLPLTGSFLMNRLLWLIISSTILVVASRLFSFRSMRKRRAKKKENIENNDVRIVRSVHFSVYPRGWKYSWASMWSQLKIEATALFKHIPFMVMLLLWIFIFGIELKDQLFNGPFGMKFYPTTSLVIEQIKSMKLSLVLLAFYVAEMVNRERTVNIQALVYTTPVGNFALWAAKCIALFVFVITLVSANILTGIVLQVSHNFYDIELWRYFSLFYYSAFPLFLFVVLMVFIQRLTTSKYLGMMLNLLVVFLFLFAPRFGLHHFMLRYASLPEMQYSYFNGFGHYAKAFDWYMLYWAAFAGILGTLTIAISADKPYLTRAQKISFAFGKVKRMSFLLVIFACGFVGVGAYIFWQSNVIGIYHNPQQALEDQVAYEKKKVSLPIFPNRQLNQLKQRLIFILRRAGM